ncbi:hypothetical protein [Microcystis aeruginosa]|uniref:Uncharacterized protein n=1 Tax=Microcystis aeruginosa FD4 TaxID=2686288 RepID=A0A857D4B0_MICAE|nr:hypothetical protein [Microcystis aeruginosa]MDB9423052.1 hypothetical protein [Microcystis aeruginosa CS-563/04]QGZ90497.1 hypothetical protein GQR42_14080 [Microcystis aeruginosa FD4]
MAQVFTRSYVQNLQSNLSIKIGQEPKSINGDQYNQYYFQLLIFENEDTPKLVYGTKEALQTKYNLAPSSFPSSGAKVDSEFSPSGQDPDKYPLAQAELSTVYFLLQTRKLSQMIAYTWLEPENIPDEMKAKVNLVRKILRFPHQKVCTYWLDNPQEAEKPISEIDLSRKLLGDSEKPTPKCSWLIQPDNISYDFIALALLLCGQAFYKDKVNFYYPDKHEHFAQIWEPIGSIYQLIFEYGLDVTWELFHGVMTELVHTGKDFPASKITVPYPPRPGEFNVSQSDIETWAKANEHDGPYPFYPIKNSDDWKNHQLKHVYPPSPYIPLSCL